MRISPVFLALLALLVATIPAARAEDLKFDQVTLVEAKPPDVSVLYVVLTEPKADKDTLDKLVVKYAKTALEQATAHKFKGTTKVNERYKVDGNVAFLVRSAAKDKQGFATGFSIEQLQEIIAAKPSDAVRLVSLHAWSFEKVPESK